MGQQERPVALYCRMPVCPTVILRKLHDFSEPLAQARGEAVPVSDMGESAHGRHRA